ncbi:unnamed protein product [Dracunculus medinensis]|uniref:GTP-binding protein RAD n=1 Tax=Dracunculus medinensis TaxID=318479 RepID=A0A0N4U8R7_DRAME|nr:unnamed protein product [Dracunculus medinensis]
MAFRNDALSSVLRRCLETGSNGTRQDSVQEMKRPLRSQSLKHRQRPAIEIKRCAQNEQQKERRRSTPNISRRFSFSQRNRNESMRTDVWPEPKSSVIEERFLRLPDSEDYTRVRQFKIDEKGAVVSRGDSFRLKKMSKISEHRNSPRPRDSESISYDPNSRAGSTSSNDGKISNDSPTTSHHYKIYIVGAVGTGKSALIGQFITSEYRNTFATEIEEYDNFVSVNIGGQESELTFYEADSNDDSWLYSDVNLYLLLYSIDSRGSLREVLSILKRLREFESTKHKPVVITGNKADLERKRSVKKGDAKNAILTYGVPHYEISVALNHHVDELLVGLIAEIRESSKPKRKSNSSIENEPSNSNSEEEEPSDFHAAIRRFSRRRMLEMGVDSELEENKCANLKPLNLIDRFRSWRRSLPKSKP